MKTIILSLSILILMTTVVNGQTKKIALRSHSGGNHTFTIFVPDEIGRMEPLDLIRVKPMPKVVLPQNTKMLKDTTLECTPHNDSIKEQKNTILPIKTPKSKPKVHVKETKKERPTTLNQKATKALRPTKSKKKEAVHQEVNTAPITPVDPKKSSIPLLVLLLTIPAILSFILYIKRL